MKKIRLILILLICVALLAGCAKPKVLKDNLKGVDRLQVVLAMGNPAYGTESKIITDADEITTFVETLRSATIVGKVAEDDVAVGDASKYIFAGGNETLYQATFNVNDSTRVWHDGCWHHVTYTDKTLYELYKESEAKVIRVDEHFNVMPTFPEP